MSNAVPTVGFFFFSFFVLFFFTKKEKNIFKALLCFLLPTAAERELLKCASFVQFHTANTEPTSNIQILDFTGKKKKKRKIHLNTQVLDKHTHTAQPPPLRWGQLK